VKTRQAGRIVSVAVIVAVGVNAEGRCEVLGMDIGPSEARCGRLNTGAQTRRSAHRQIKELHHGWGHDRKMPYVMVI